MTKDRKVISTSANAVIRQVGIVSNAPFIIIIDCYLNNYYKNKNTNAQ